MELERKLNRRGLLGAAGAVTAAGAMGPLARFARGDGTTCPPTVRGTVLGQTGTISGDSLASTDVMFDVDPPTFQRQCFSILSNFGGVADRYRQNQVMANEKWLLVNLIAAVQDYSATATFSTGTYSVGVTSTDPDGTLRTVNATYYKYGKACGYTQKDAASGTVTVTSMDESTLVEASYDLVFGHGDRVQGSFSAPRCVLCGPRPDRTCIKA